MIGFNKNELKVFKALAKNPQAVASLARKTKMPRMTVYTILLRLKKSNIAKEVKNKTGKRLLWVKNQESDIQKSLDETVGIITHIIPTRNGDLVRYKGKKELSDIVMELTNQKIGGTMYAIQNAHTFSTWVHVMGEDWVNKHNKAVTKNKITAFTIHSPVVPESIIKNSSIIEAYKGRMGNSKVIPESFLKKDLILYLFDDVLLFVDLGNIEAVRVVNKELVLFIIKLFSFIFEKGKEEDFFLTYNKTDH